LWLILELRFERERRKWKLLLLKVIKLMLIYFFGVRECVLVLGLCNTNSCT
jgi:hypothetical protein